MGSGEPVAWTPLPPRLIAPLPCLPRKRRQEQGIVITQRHRLALDSTGRVGSGEAEYQESFFADGAFGTQMKAVQAERERRARNEERCAQDELRCELQAEQERLDALQQEVDAVQSLMGVCSHPARHQLRPSGKPASRAQQQRARRADRGEDGGDALEVAQLQKAHARGPLRAQLQVVHEVRLAGARRGGRGRDGRGNHRLHPRAACPLSVRVRGTLASGRRRQTIRRGRCSRLGSCASQAANLAAKTSLVSKHHRKRCRAARAFTRARNQSTPRGSWRGKRNFLDKNKK